MKPDIRLSLFHDGKLRREPVLLTIVGLREALLLASDFNEAKVNRIFQTLEETANAVWRLHAAPSCSKFRRSYTPNRHPG